MTTNSLDGLEEKKMNELKSKYSMKSIVLHKESIKTFHVYEKERRMIRGGKVKSLMIAFNKDNPNLKHFDSPLVVNNIGSKLNLIDGNHRVEAIKQYLKKNQSFKIKIWMAEYKGLTRDEEREIYSKWNQGTPETATDYLKWHFDTIPLGQKMMELLPVSVYGSESKMPLKSLLGAHLIARNPQFRGSYCNSKERMMSDFRELKMEDLEIIASWYKDMSLIFGSYYKGHPFYRSTPKQVFYKIWFDNTHIPRKSFINAFKSVFVNKSLEWESIIKTGGRDACYLFYDMALKILQKRRPSLKFRSWED